MDATDCVSITEAAKKLGISDFTMRSRVRAGELPVFENPLDRRRKLIPVSALEDYARLRPAAPRSEESAPSLPRENSRRVSAA